MSADLRRDLVAALADFYVGHPDAQRFSMLDTVGSLLVAALAADEVVEPDPVALPVARLLAGCESAIDVGSAVPGVGAVLRAFTAAAPIWFFPITKTRSRKANAPPRASPSCALGCITDSCP